MDESKRVTITLRVPRWVVKKAKDIAGEKYEEFLSRVLEHALRDPKIIEESM